MEDIFRSGFFEFGVLDKGNFIRVIRRIFISIVGCY